MKKINKKRLAHQVSAAKKRNKITLQQKRKKQILQVQLEHNKIKYRNLPGLKGKFPYQLTPWTFGQTEEFMKTGINPTLRGGDLKMVIVTLNDNQVTGVTDKDSGAALDFEVVVANSLSTPVDPTSPTEGEAVTPGAEEAPSNPPVDTPASDEGETTTQTTTDTTEVPANPESEVTGHAEVPLSDGSSVEVDVTEHPAA